MNPDQIEAIFRQQLLMLPPPAGIPPASVNPKVIEAGQKLIKQITEILIQFGYPSPTIPLPPPPPSPGSVGVSMDASDLHAVFWDEVDR
jgi:hypothetical protein